MPRTEEEEEEHRMNQHDDEEEGDATEPTVKTRKEVGDSIQFAIQVQCFLLIALYNFMLQYMKVWVCTNTNDSSAMKSKFKDMLKE